MDSPITPAIAVTRMPVSSNERAYVPREDHRDRAMMPVCTVRTSPSPRETLAGEYVSQKHVMPPVRATLITATTSAPMSDSAPATPQTASIPDSDGTLAVIAEGCTNRRADDDATTTWWLG
jgi:hypothetical protein